MIFFLSRRYILSIGWFLLCTRFVLADDVVPYDPSLPAGTICRLEIIKARPTQFAVGKWEVTRRVDKISKLKPDKLLQYLDEHRATIVIGPQGEPYVIDGHHISYALLKSKISFTIEAKVEANLRDLSPADFWDTMQKKGWAYLYDENGLGPLEPNKLPKTIADLADDPYRSLAWAVREEGGWNKSPSSFAEFQWAQFYRKRIKIEKLPGGFEKAVKEAIKISHSPDAKNLPGYTPLKPETPG
jgi:hypothetical protein